MLIAGSKIFNRYEIIKHLGSGGMGDVYLVTDALLNNQQLALKLLKADFLKKEGSKERFLREVELARQVTHSNVLRTFDVGEDPKLGIYFTMEYANGKTLSTLLERGAIKYQQAIIIISQLLSGLEKIHNSHIVHRDLKPSNIIINQDGVVQIMDFGIARSGDSQLTTTSEVLGSGPYMSPEQWKGGHVTARTDLYGVGVILFELLTGIQPFYADTAPQQMYKHLVELPQLSLSKTELPTWLNQLTSSLLAKDPIDRPSSAREVIELIEAKMPMIKISSSFQLGVGGSDLIFEARGSEDFYYKQPVAEGNWVKGVGIGLALIALMSMGFAGSSIFSNRLNKQQNVAPTVNGAMATPKVPLITKDNLNQQVAENLTKGTEQKTSSVSGETSSNQTAGTYNKVRFKTPESLPLKDRSHIAKADLLAKKKQNNDLIAAKLRYRLQQMTPEEKLRYLQK